MGHSSIGTTGVYLQKSTKKIKEDFEKYHSRKNIFKIVEMTG
jgi:site-specific recombinase XerD